MVGDASMLTQDVVAEIAPDQPQWELMREFSLLKVDDGVLHRPFGTLSNGEQTKVLLAALFCRKNNFLLIDEPTNHLDVHGRELVAHYLNRKKGFILVSHDRNSLDACIDHILTINKANIEVVKGKFSTWLNNKELQDNFELAENES
jgi:lincosamide and streptogramin A transport system ATP-binding/permease protein